MPKYQGNDVTVNRPAQQGDVGFDAAKTPQTLIRLGDGSLKVVPASEVTG